MKFFPRNKCTASELRVTVKFDEMDKMQEDHSFLLLPHGVRYCSHCHTAEVLYNQILFRMNTRKDCRCEVGVRQEAATTNVTSSC